MIEQANDYVTDQLNGNKLMEDKMVKIIDAIRLYHQYINRKQTFLHKKNIISNMSQAIVNHSK